MTHPSVSTLWTAYRAENEGAPELPAAVFHFCDNAEDAAICLDLVLKGKKRATAASLAELELSGSPVPQVGDLSVVTDFDGVAHGIIRTTQVDIRAFDDVDGEFAAAEGEGDGSLEWWRNAHAAYYGRVLSGHGIAVDGNLQIACERFVLVASR